MGCEKKTMEERLKNIFSKKKIIGIGKTADGNYKG
jgi:hypothetical protein